MAITGLYRVIFSSIALSLATAATAMGAAPAVQHLGIEAGFTTEGLPYLGSASAPLTLEEWSDYLCPFCRRHFTQASPELIERYVRPGKMRIVFHDFPIASLHPTSAQGHVAALCAGAQGAPAFWAMHDALFARQEQWASLPDPARYLLDLATSLKLDAARIKSCTADGGAAARVKQSIAKGESLGITGTPAFRFHLTDNAQNYPVSGAQPVERFVAIADALLAGETPPEEPKPPAPELPAWAKPEGLAPDPQRPGYTMAGDAFKGDPAAKVVVVEFSDFECPACAKHVLEVQPGIDAEFVAKGRIRWVSKHLPLRSHPHAALAAAAAECAGEQGQYWKMHDLLFSTVAEWAVADQESRLIALAPRAGLGQAAFKRCLDSRQAMERVLQDIYDAQGVIERVPRFVILSDGKSGRLTGPLPAAQFAALLSDEPSPPKPLPEAQDPAPTTQR